MESKILGSRYELQERIGMGGMAIVYKAFDNTLNRYVAVKILREEYKENEEFIRRFNVESQAAASLSHQNIVQIYDVGEEDGVHYIVMELLEGETLKQYMNARGGKLSLREATNFAMQICRALEHAHSKHVVHRDIKPQNIIITENGKLKVADFGIARAANNSTMVNAGKNAIGSAHYLSPEQARGGYTDLRSDIYSLGVVMYEMFTGKLPFDAEESVSVVLQHLQDDPVLPCELNPELPPGIEAIVVRCMKKEQRLRYNNATEILEDLVKVYQRPAINVRALNALKSEGMSDIPKRQPQKKKPSQSQQVKKPSKKKSHKGLVATIVIGILLLLSLIGYLVYSFLFPKSSEVKIPDVIGMSYEEAGVAVKEASTDNVIFTLEATEEYSDEPKGTIISQDPEGGWNVKRSREIHIVISKGPQVIELDDYKGEHIDDIKEALEEKGLIVTVLMKSNDAYDKGIIFSQNPDKGKKLAAGEEVKLYVSEGSEEVTVPDVCGMSREKAIAALDEKGLTVADISEEPSTKYEKGFVCKQSIDAGERVPEGTEINICISSGETEEEKKEDEEEKEEPKKEPEKEPEAPTTPQVAPSEKPSTKRVTVSLSNLPKKPNNETVTVRLLMDGVCVYESDVSSGSSSTAVSFDVPSSANVAGGIDVYYDGVYRTTTSKVTVNE